MEPNPIVLRQIVHTWMFGDLPIESIADSLAKIGADGADLGVSKINAYNNVEEFLKKDLAAVFTSRGLSIGAVTPLFYERDLDLSGPDKAIRDSAIGFCKLCIELTGSLGCSQMLIVPSWIKAPHKFYTSLEEDWKRAAGSIAELAGYASGFGVTLMIEPVNRYLVTLVHTIAEAKRMAADACMPNVSVAPDTFHMGIEEPDDLQSAIRRCGRELGILHVAEKNRRAPGFGIIDWTAVLQALDEIGFAGCLSHEPFRLYFDEKLVASDPDYRSRFEDELSESVKFLKNCMSAADLRGRCTP